MCIECRLKERAYFIWQREGCPAGRALDNWLEAKSEEISLRAYFIWERQGYPEGRALDCWLEAEKELAGELRRLAENERRLALLKLRSELDLVCVLAAAVLLLVGGVALAYAYGRLGGFDALTDLAAKSDDESA